MTNELPVLIRFTRGVGINGAIVRWFTWSQWAHVGFRLPDGTILDATPEHGVARRTDTDDLSTRYFIPAVPQGAIDKAIAWATSQISKPYDWQGIYGFAVHRDWHRPTAWFCSEYVVAAFEHAEAPILRYDTNTVDRITPRDVYLSPLLRPVMLQPTAHRLQTAQGRELDTIAHDYGLAQRYRGESDSEYRSYIQSAVTTL